MRQSRCVDGGDHDSHRLMPGLHLAEHSQITCAARIAPSTEEGELYSHIVRCFLQLGYGPLPP